MKTTTAEQLIVVGRLIDSGLLSDLLDADPGTIDRAEFRKSLGLTPLDVAVSRVMPVESGATGILVVDYSLNLQQMIAAGKYDWTNSNIIEERFPVKPQGQVAEKVEYEYMLDYPNRDISTNDELKRVASIDKDNPWQVAEISHLLAYGAAHPEDQRKFPIIGLGSVADVGGYRGCPCLGSDGSERGLYLGLVVNDWDAGCRFLLVRRKVSVASVS